MPTTFKVSRRSNLPPLVPSAALAAVIGPEPRPRSQVLKAVWRYIHDHGLQDAIDKRVVNPDAALGQVLGVTPINMFAMQKELSKHLGKASTPAAGA